MKIQFTGFFAPLGRRAGRTLLCSGNTFLNVAVMKHLAVGIICILLGNFALIAAEVPRYKGLLDVRVIEANAAQYILGVKFRSSYSKPVDFVLRPYNGKATVEAYQAFYENNDGDDKRTFNISHKYYFSLRIREVNDERYTATVKLYRRIKSNPIDIDKPYFFKTDDFKPLAEHPVEGQFTVDNEYLFVGRSGLKFYIKLNFDIIFTREEIIQRFKSRQ